MRWKNADKLSHLIEYSALGFLLVRAFFGSRIFPALLPCALLAIAAGLATGLADEIFQSGIVGRVSSVEDFRADALGVLIGTVVYAVAKRAQGS